MPERERENGGAGGRVVFRARLNYEAEVELYRVFYKNKKKEEKGGEGHLPEKGVWVRRDEKKENVKQKLIIDTPTFLFSCLNTP